MDLEPDITASHLGERLEQLYLERARAATTGLSGDGAYMADLRAEITECRAAYVAAAVVEIAELRAGLAGRLIG